MASYRQRIQILNAESVKQNTRLKPVEKHANEANTVYECAFQL